MSEENTVSQPNKLKKKRSKPRMLNILLFIAIIVVSILFARAEMARRSAESDLNKKSQELEQIKNSTQNSSQEAANAILAKVKMLINLPTEPAPTVATITDVDALRKTNDFYKKASNGDNLIITTDRAILYSPVQNIIIDVVPVQIDPNASPGVSPSVSPSSSPRTSPTPSTSPLP